MIYILSVSLC